MRKISTLIFCILFTSIAISQQEYEEVVYLKNGSIIKGIIIEQVPDVSVKIQTKDGNIFVYKMEEIERITKEPVQTSVQTDDVVTSGIDQNLAGKFSLSGFGGFAFPMGDLADDDIADNHESLYRTIGPQFGVAFDYFFTPGFGAGLQFKYVSLPSTEWEIIETKPDQDDVMTILQIGVHGKYIFIPDGSVRPYGKFGFGMVMISLTDFPLILPPGTHYIPETDIEVDNRFYLEFVAGVMFFVSPQVSLFAELSYDYLMLDGAETKVTNKPKLSWLETGDIDINPYYIGIIAGINIWFGGTD
jgi:hypothetical protein